jgi:hypothetical protein
MGRILLLLVVVLLVAGMIGVVVLGAFPPDPRTQQIQKVLPNDRFQKGT